MSLFVRVVAPTGRDSELITGVLQQHGVQARASTIAAFLADAAGDALLGPLLIAEEALSPGVIQELGVYIHDQPSWSDLPILILTGSGRETLQSSRLQAERLPLGSPVLLERPIRTASLISSVQAAFRARDRQYQIRDAVAALKEERELLGAMLDHLPVGVVLANATGRIIRVNRRLEEIVRKPVLLNHPREDDPGWIAIHSSPSGVAADDSPLAAAIRTRLPVPPQDHLLERGDGTHAWISWAAAPILNDAGSVTGAVSSLSDIDLQKRSELALIQSEKLAAVGRLAASISHEINNPLGAVINLLYLARLDRSIPDDVRGFLDTADQELSRVSQIVTHTLRFHRQSSKPQAITAEDLLEPTLGLYSGRLLNANIELDVRHRAGEAVTCYEGEIRQVLNNLLSNAIESMKLGGKLSIRSRGSRSWKDGRAGIRITIADTGHGMDRSTLNSIFEAFFTTKGMNGTGLGLWISKGIVEKHLGSLLVFSSVASGRSGTAFSLFLPRDPFDGASQSQNARAAGTLA